jgi:type VI secretion system secreted protein VgrG
VKGATIGYGHLIRKKDWPRFRDGITQEEADLLFQADIGPYVDKVNEVITADLKQHEFDALVIFAYNIGEEGFATSSAAKLVNDPDASTPYPDLESAWKAWNQSQGKINRGLINRRAAEWDMYSRNIYRYW